MGEVGRLTCVMQGSTCIVVAATGCLAEATGHAADELLSVELPTLFHADDSDLVAGIFDPRTPATGRLNLRIRLRGGGVRCVRCTYARALSGHAAELAVECATALRAAVEDRTLVTNFIAMMENTDDYIYFKDRNHVFTGASQTLVRLTNPSERWQDLIGKTDYDVFPEQLADRYYRLEQRVFAGDVDVAREIQPTLDNDGRHGWVDNRKYPIRDATGAIVGLFGVARDITAFKAANDARAEALERLQKIAAQIPGVVFQYRLHPDGRSDFPYVSEAVREFYGVTPDALAADAAAGFAVVHPDDLQGLFASIERSAEQMTPWSHNHRVLVKGTVRHMYGKAVPQQQADGAVLWHGFMTDITDVEERRRTEADLQVAATAFESHEALMVTDARTRILKVNRAFSEMTGYDPAEVVGQTPRLLSSGRHSQEFYAALWECIGRTGSWRGEVVNQRKNGELYPAWLSITAVRGSNGEVTHYVGATIDMTERRQLEEQLRHAQKLEAVGQLAGGIAHDFNNLLTVILTYSSLAIDSLGAHPSAGDLEEVRRAALHARDLTQQLLAFGRKQVLEPKTLDLNVVVERAARLLGRLMGVDVEVCTDCEVGLRLVRADPTQIDQVLMNLSINARDAMASGGTLTLSTRNVRFEDLRSDEPGDESLHGSFVELAVSDTGTGMSSATRARVFEPFFTTKGVGKGTGLGLATVYGIVKQSGGTIRVETELGRGTTFHVYLPPTVGSAPPEPAVGEAPAASLMPMTILVVDDTDAVRRVACRALERAGYSVLSAANGEEALRVAQSHTGTIDMLVTDLVMPRMDGRVLAKRLLEKRVEAAVLFMSGYSGEALGRDGELDEGAHFLAKPFTAATLTARVREILARRV